MTGKFLKDGKEALALALAGKHQMNINGMYVTFGPRTIVTPPDSCHDKFQRMLESKASGYARVAVTDIAVTGTKLTFSAIVTDSDFKGATPTENSLINTATLVSMVDEKETNDKFIFSTVMLTPTKMVKNATTVVKVSMEIGE